ncbi:hypothetical protein HKK80_08440 [Halonotius sp. F2-221B]|jgi:hypothetical protein|uniref:hypothetical protein n=1 Tax=Halonotius sp. F2-221B TaxID=2731620 RepID=UPI00398BA8B9
MAPPPGKTEGPDASTRGSQPAESTAEGRNRRRAALYALPFLALGVGNAVLILNFGLEPLWAFAQLPPILFTTALTYIVFSTDFLDDR